MSRRCQITGKDAQFGHNVSHSQIKTNRRFNVNIQSVRIYSDVLQKYFKLKIAASTLRSIDHNGGLDNFLLKTSNLKLQAAAKKIKKQILKKKEVA